MRVVVRPPVILVIGMRLRSGAVFVGTSFRIVIAATVGIPVGNGYHGCGWCGRCRRGRLLAAGKAQNDSS